VNRIAHQSPQHRAGDPVALIKCREEKGKPFLIEFVIGLKGRQQSVGLIGQGVDEIGFSPGSTGKFLQQRQAVKGLPDIDKERRDRDLKQACFGRKKPHRRIISKAFIEEAIRVLNIQGTLELRTDSDNYYMYSYETLMSLRQLSLEVHKNRAIAISSKYEDRWRLMDKNIYDLILHNTEESPLQPSPGTFAFPPHLLNVTRLHELNGKTVTFEEGFIHFERLYSIEGGGMLLRLSLGSFERPEHLYLMFGDKETIYFPQEPIATRTNHAIHRQLIKELHG